MKGRDNLLVNHLVVMIWRILENHDVTMYVAEHASADSECVIMTLSACTIFNYVASLERIGDVTVRSDQIQ